MLTTASQFTPRARSLQTTHAAIRVLSISGAAAAAGVQHRQQQTRSFRFGPWSSYRDPEFHREVLRRHRTLKIKFAETIARRLSWEKHPAAEDARQALRRLVKGFVLSSSTPLGARRFSAEEVKQRQKSDDKKVWPGQGLGDAARESSEYLVYGGEGSLDGRWQFKPLATQKQKEEKQMPRVVHNTAYGGFAQNFVIDPITNRKVAKHPSRDSPHDGVNIPVRTFREYRSQFSKPGDNPKSSASASDDVTAEEIQFYRNVDIDSDPNDYNAALNSSGVQQPILESDEYVRNHGSCAGPNENQFPGGYVEPDAATSSDRPKYDDLVKYKPVMYNENAPVEDATTARYDDLHRYKHVMGEDNSHFQDLKPPYEDLGDYTSIRYQEPDGKPEPSAEELSRIYDPKEVAKYKAVRWNEPDGKPEPSSEELSKNYDPEEVAKYQAVKWNEPNGKPEPSSEELSKNYTDLSEYAGAVRYNEPDGKPPGYHGSADPAALRKHKEPIRKLDPDEKHEITAEMIAEQLSKNYDPEELKKYTAVRYLEPDGKPGPSAEELSKNYDDLSNYAGPVMYNEPDGKPPPTAEELSKNYQDLSDYSGPVRWNEPDGQPAPSAEELSRNYKDLSKYNGPVKWNEPDGRPEPTVEELSKIYKDLSDYDGPVRWNEPDGQPAPTAEELSRNYPDLSKYDGPVTWNEPDGKPEPTSEELSKHYTDLGQYTAVKWNEPDGKPELTTEELTKIYDDLDGYKEAVRYQEPDGKVPVQADPVQEGLGDFAAQQKDCAKAAHLASSTMDSADDLSAKSRQKLDQAAESEESEKTNYRKMLDSFMRQHHMTSDAVDREARIAVNEAKAKLDESPEKLKRELTGDYVRDFPEDFKETWSTENSASKDTLAPASETYTNRDDTHSGKLLRDDKVLYETQNMDGGLEGAFGQPATPKIEPALHRVTTNKKGTDGQETSFAEEWNTTPQEVTSDSSAKPTLYKVLAYDATTQEINVAETSSVLADISSSLTPAEALLQLSNPSKFFPYFAPLQSQGFEILAGNGDVLVFRKVGSTDEKTDNVAEKDAEPATRTTRVNPIDMTGRPRHFSPASANFASPTGYVNYENIPEANETDLPPPPPRFKSNIDVRREEPVFSGPKTEQRDTRKKHGVGKRLVVGAAWVAGISYALGVVGEYFTTGGVDGLGPKGF